MIRQCEEYLFCKLEKKENLCEKSLEAMQEYGIMRLASRITDLKKAGYPIRREMVSRKNRYGETVSFARYSLAER